MLTCGMVDEFEISKMAEDLDDGNFSSGIFHSQIDGRMSCERVSDFSKEDYLSQPNGNCFDADPRNEVELRTLKSHLKRRSPVTIRRSFTKYRSHKEGSNGIECSKTLSDVDGDDKDYLNVESVRKRENRNSRETRNSAGASGGIFTQDFDANFGDLDSSINGKVVCLYSFN